MTAAAFLAIVLVDLVAAMNPRPAFVVSVGAAAAEGFRPAADFALGVGLAGAVRAAAALTGLTLLFEVAPGLLASLKLAGGAFLVWIAVATRRHADAPPPARNAALPMAIAATPAAGFIRVGRLFSLDGPRAACRGVRGVVERIFGGLIAAFGIRIAAS